MFVLGRKSGKENDKHGRRRKRDAAHKIYEVEGEYSYHNRGISMLLVSYQVAQVLV